MKFSVIIIACLISVVDAMPVIYNDRQVEHKFNVVVPENADINYYRQNCSVFATPKKVDIYNILSILEIFPMGFGCDFYSPIALSDKYMLVIDSYAKIPQFGDESRSFVNAFICPRYALSPSAYYSVNHTIAEFKSNVFCPDNSIWDGARMSAFESNLQGFEYNRAAFQYRNFVQNVLPMLLEARLAPQQNQKILKRELAMMLDFACEENYLFAAKMLLHIESSGLLSLDKILPLPSEKNNKLKLVNKLFSGKPYHLAEDDMANESDRQIAKKINLAVGNYEWERKVAKNPEAAKLYYPPQD